ncbi:39S ribosomal protein L32, mitochondrial-like [Anneissia japonica]|uniref:39S ribosomal protein L32, mitochondrial-like n=1 Tax=Anneissia japonica TaxID=1529436 RepID=UPI001425B34D|nr:39S ribosomal protein L32, mitochondrial-like [Anneissia japonica]
MSRIFSSYLRKLQSSIQNFDRWLQYVVSGYPPFGGVPALTTVSNYPSQPLTTEGSIFDGIFWAVPKKRRSIQRNRTRRRAIEKRVVAVTDIIPCSECGHPKRKEYLCSHCLIRIREETSEIQKQMFKESEESGDLPDKKIVVLYEGEGEEETDKGEAVRVVEMKKRRPSWFPKGLLSASGR